MKTIRNKKTSGNKTTTTIKTANVNTVKTVLVTDLGTIRTTKATVNNNGVIDTHSINIDVKGKVQFKCNVTTVINGGTKNVVNNGSKVTTTIEKENITTVKTNQGFMKITTATVSNDFNDDVYSYTVKKNGKAKVQYITKLNNVDVNKIVVPKEAKFKGIFGIETFIDLRDAILDYAEAEEIDFYTALEEVTPHSDILKSGLEEHEIAILLDIPFESVSKIIKVSAKKLKKVRELVEMNNEFKLNNKSYMVLDNANSTEPMYHTQGSVVA